jgi:hypothetical protein
MRISNIDSSTIDIEPIKRNNKIIGYGTWLSQGDEFDPTEYYIGYHELDSYIEELIKTRDNIKKLME